LRLNFTPDYLYKNLLAIVAIVAGYAAYLIPHFFKIQRIEGFCFFHKISGIPCPACGMGRATIQLISGNFIDSLLMHPLAIPFTAVAFVGLIWLTTDIFKKKTSLLCLFKTRMKQPYIILLAIVLLLTWCWNIYRVL